MALPSLKNRVGCATATTGTGTITLGSAETGYQSFATAYGANANVDILIEDGDAWEIARDCTYNNGAGTVTRGTLEASSTGSAINLSGAAKVYVIDTAERINHFVMASRGHIEGLGITYSNTTAVVVEAGSISVNGKMYTLAQTTYTSGSTMKDLANSTVTLGNSKCYFVYAYNNSGTLEIRFEERDGAGDGADPTWDSDLDYWKAPSTGANARRIGKIWTDTGGSIIRFWVTRLGRLTKFSVENVGTLVVLNSGTATSYTSITTTPFLTTDDVIAYLGLQISQTTFSANTIALMNLSIDAGNSYVTVIGARSDDTYVPLIRLRPVSIPYRGTLHYAVVDVNSAGSVIILGSEFFV